MIALAPVVYLVVRSLEAGPREAASVVFDLRTLRLLVRTVGLAGAVSAGSMALGAPLAWLVSSTDLPGRRAWSVLLALPLAVPSYVAAYAYVGALGPRGLLQGALAPLGVERLPSIYGFPGAFVVLTLASYPYVFLAVRAGLASLDPAIEEASRSLGAGRWRTFRLVVLPQLRPHLAAGGLLAGLYTLHDFGAVSILRFDSFTRAIHLRYQGSFDRTGAALLSLVLVVVTLFVMAGERRVRRRAVADRSVVASRARSPVELGRGRGPSLLACGVVGTLGLGIPLGVPLVWLLRGLQVRESTGAGAELLWNSLGVAGLGAVVAVVAALPVAWVAVRHPSRLARLTERAAFAGHGLPGLVVALSLVFLGIRLVPFLYQTIVLLVVAYLVLFLPQALGVLRGSLLQVRPGLEEAALSLGTSRLGVAVRVTMPLVVPGVVSALGLVFLTTMKELPATLLLAPTGFSTLATAVWDASSQANFVRAAGPALVLVVVSAVPLALAELRPPARRRRRAGAPAHHPPAGAGPGLAPPGGAR